MSVIYKNRFTRQAVTDDWPLTHFVQEYLNYYVSEIIQTKDSPNNIWNPIALMNGKWEEVPGFESYSYEEYDPSTDKIAEDLYNSNTDTMDFVTMDKKLTYNPNSLTHTSVITFDTVESLSNFIDLCNSQWRYPSKDAVMEYIASKGMGVTEEIYLDGIIAGTNFKLY